MLNAQSERVLHYSQEALFDLAASIDRYPEFLPGWIRARIYERGADFSLAEQTVGFGPVQMQFRSRAALKRPQRIEVTSDDSQFRRFRILWTFEPDRAGLIRVALGVELDLRSRLLQMGVDRLGAATATEALSAFEQQARRRLEPASQRP